MSTTWLPCGYFHQNYEKDHAWFQTSFIKGKMISLFIILFIIIPIFAGDYWISVCNNIGYTILGALGVQLLIGYCGQVTLGHAAFLAVGAYTSTVLVLKFPWPIFMVEWGLTYPVSVLIGAFAAGIWCLIFGLPSARVKGFYLILTTMAAQFITVDFIITQYITNMDGIGQALSLPPGIIKIGPWTIDNDLKVYFMMLIIVILFVMGLSNILRSKIGRAWVAIRDNDISAEVMGINVIGYKLLAFFTAGFIGGTAGAFWISNIAAVSTEHFPWSWSLWLVAIIIIGGVGSLRGVIFGAVFMVVVGEILQLLIIPIAGTTLGEKLLMEFFFVKEAVFGLIICAFMILEPKGISYRWWQLKNYFNLWPFSY